VLRSCGLPSSLLVSKHFFGDTGLELRAICAQAVNALHRLSVGQTILEVRANRAELFDELGTSRHHFDLAISWGCLASGCRSGSTPLPLPFPSRRVLPGGGAEAAAQLRAEHGGVTEQQ
jgi:hypothetical protein